MIHSGHEDGPRGSLVSEAQCTKDPAGNMLQSTRANKALRLMGCEQLGAEHSRDTMAASSCGTGTLSLQLEDCSWRSLRLCTVWHSPAQPFFSLPRLGSDSLQAPLTSTYFLSFPSSRTHSCLVSASWRTQPSTFARRLCYLCCMVLTSLLLIVLLENHPSLASVHEIRLARPCTRSSHRHHPPGTTVSAEKAGNPLCWLGKRCILGWWCGSVVLGLSNMHKSWIPSPALRKQSFSLESLGCWNLSLYI